MGRIRFRLARFSQRQMREIAPNPAPSVPPNAPADPLKKPTQPILALIGAPNGKPKEGFVWEETTGID
jgi:hypothetical protein